MNKLSIRVKMVLWYSSLTAVLLVLFLPFLYVFVSKSMLNDEEGMLRTAASQAILGCELDNDNLSWNAGTKLPDGINFSIVKTDGSTLFTNNQYTWVSSEPFRVGEIRTESRQNTTWMVYDESVKNETQLIAYVRVCVSLESVNAFLSRIKILMLIAAPIYLLIAVFGSLFIARKALLPISQITKTAADIEYGDFSLRIEGIHTTDEVGHLADTFNSMLEHLESSFRRERQFSSDASHELRTPVSIILAYSEALIAKLNKRKNNIDEDELNSVKLIHAECEKTNIIISQLLMLARGYEHKYPMEIESIDLNEIISDVMDQLQETASENNISLQYSPQDGLAFLADQSLITRMFINLIENGIKYGKTGGYVKVFAQKQTDGMHITVEDNGIGIDPSDLPFVFDRFYRADQSRDRSGTGLGLSIVKWIVNEHKGKISAISELNRGTTFFIVL